ncbi:MAG: SAM-dependent methyltransferase [Streptosporangiaceae bacterium]
MAVNDRASAGGKREPPEIDTAVAHVARVYDYLLGGSANFRVDREAAEQAYAAWPGGLIGVRADALAHRALLGRMVRYLVRDAGIRQFLDIGTGIPKEDNVHEVAQRQAPESRVVYVDNDPIVLAHAHRLLRGSIEGATTYIFGELREPGTILDEAAETLDLGQPVAIMLLGVLHFLSAADDPAAVVRELMSPLPPGSYLALSHLARDVAGDAMTETFSRLNSQMAESVVLRTREEVARLFGRLEMVEPGVVQLPQWHPDPDAPPPGPLPMWCGVARKTADHF